MMAEAVRVEGLRELRRAFKLAGRGMEKAIDEALEAASEPVKTDAQSLAISSIPRVGISSAGIPWSSMRVGVKSNVAYIVPAARGNRAKRRRNFGDILLSRAMEPALDRNIDNVEKQFALEVGEVFRAWERV